MGDNEMMIIAQKVFLFFHIKLYSHIYTGRMIMGLFVVVLLLLLLLLSCFFKGFFRLLFFFWGGGVKGEFLVYFYSFWSLQFMERPEHESHLPVNPSIVHIGPKFISLVYIFYNINLHPRPKL